MNASAFKTDLISVYKLIIIICTPILASPILLGGDTVSSCAYAIVIMAVYWMTEVVPLAVTALLPIVLFPLLGIQPSADVCQNYFKDTVFLFFGGLLVAIAVEDCNLHKRIALRVLLAVGSKPRWLMFGVMATTAFLSMWISNTATAAMMTPIVQAVLDEIDRTREEDAGETSADPSAPPSYADAIELDAEETMIDSDRKNGSKISNRHMKNIRKGMLLSVAYAANIGGTATLTGTGPNLVVSGVVETLYGSDTGIDFGTWMAFATPGMLVCLLIAWLWLRLIFLGDRCAEFCCPCRKSAEESGEGAARVKNVIRSQYDALGPIKFSEIVVLAHFAILALLWLSRDPKFVEGWSVLFKDKYVTDASTGMTIAMVLFLFPSQLPRIFCCRDHSDSTYELGSPSNGDTPVSDDTNQPISRSYKYEPILKWSVVQKKLAWNVIILLGGGFALADGVKESGLSDWLGEKFEGLSELPDVVMLIIVCVVVAFVTEFTSNTSTASVFLPILGQLGASIGVNPLYLMVPATVCCSFAFMLPVATPPNAIVFSYGSLRVFDMAKVGVVMNFACIAVVVLNTYTMGILLFDVTTFPDWALGDDVVTTIAPVMNCTI